LLNSPSDLVIHQISFFKDLEDQQDQQINAEWEKDVHEFFSYILVQFENYDPLLQNSFLLSYEQTISFLYTIKFIEELELRSELGFSLEVKNH
jgi:hypothetical protein